MRAAKDCIRENMSKIDVLNLMGHVYGITSEKGPYIFNSGREPDFKIVSPGSHLF